MPRRLILLRHGRTAWNAERRFQGHADPPLDDVGRAQAYEAAPIVAALRPDLLVSSTARRALQTAEVVSAATGMSIIREPRLVERGLGAWEGLTVDEVAAAFPREYADWTSGTDIDRPGGESRSQVASRCLAALDDLPAAALTVVVTHGAAAGTITNTLLGLPLELHPFRGLANCHWTELEHTGASWRMVGYNLGALGTVVPMPEHVPERDADAGTDADA